MKKTRKFKNKKLFLKWLKKSHKNDYSIKHGGETKGNGKKGDSSSSPKLVGESVVTKKKAFALAAVVTLGQVAYSLASNPMVVSAIVGLGIGTNAFIGVASAGASVVLIAIGAYAYFKITAAYSNYYTMLHVMNDFILLLQKIDIMVRVAIKISQQYQFVIDTKDVNKCLERIFSRFDKLLSIQDITDIKKDVENPNIRIEDKLNEAAESAEEQLYEDASEEGTLIKKEDPAEIKLKVSFMDKFKQFFNILKFNSKKFTSQLNEEVIRLGLYFSILLGEFNIILNVSQMTIIEKRDFKLLLTNNTGVKSSSDFKKLLISSIIYRTLQIYNIFELCTPGASISDAAKKTTCSKEMIDQYIDEIETERVKIRKVLFGKSKVTKQFLFPLYQDRSGNSSELNILRGIMRGFNNSIEDEKEARDFCKKIHDFNEKYSSTTKEKRSDSSTGSTISTDNLDEDYYEDTEEAPEEAPPKTATPPHKHPPALPLPRNTTPPPLTAAVNQDGWANFGMMNQMRLDDEAYKES
jgi:hypothetical protein